MRTWPTLSLALVAALARPAVVDACAVAPPRGEEVRIAAEEAIILWDEDTKTEHFIRRAGFASSSDKFGFLVPTPGIPKLAEIDGRVFGQLASAIRPETRTEYEGREYVPGCACLVFDAKDAAKPSVDSVRVLEIASVAGYDASILQADDSKALAQWLGEHGFEATPELEAWLEPYVRNKWTVTAFEVAATSSTSKGAKQAGSAAVSMSFETMRPFYPYREPANQQQPATGKLRDLVPGSRLLRIFFIGDARVDALLGAEPWPAQVLWAGPIPSVPSELAAMVGDHRHLTVFHDETSPRRGIDEVWFADATDQTAVRPAPIVTIRQREVFIPLEPILMGAAILGFVTWRRRRRRRSGVA